MTLAARHWGGEPRVRLISVIVVAVVALALAGCTAGTGGSSVSTPSVAASPSASVPASSAPGASGTPATSPGGSGGTVSTPQQALAAIVATDPRFLGYEQLDPNLIGQANYFEAERVDGGFELTFVAGSGDCPAGCINRDFAKFRVTENGEATLVCEWSEGEEPRGTRC